MNNDGDDDLPSSNDDTDNDDDDRDEERRPCRRQRGLRSFSLSSLAPIAAKCCAQAWQVDNVEPEKSSSARKSDEDRQPRFNVTPKEKERDRAAVAEVRR